MVKISKDVFLSAARVIKAYCEQQYGKCEECPANSGGKICCITYPIGWRFCVEESQEDAVKADAVNHPAHYTQGGVECIDAIEAATGDGFAGYLAGNVIKYLWRYRHKSGVEDLRKARWYLDRLIAVAKNATTGEGSGE